MDPTSLLISPLSSFFGNVTLAGISGLWIACLLSCTELRLYRPIWLILYLCDLPRQLQESYGVIGELQTVSSGFSSVMKDQTEVAGRALASFWVVKYHLMAVPVPAPAPARAWGLSSATFGYVRARYDKVAAADSEMSPLCTRGFRWPFWVHQGLKAAAAR